MDDEQLLNGEEHDGEEHDGNELLGELSDESLLEYIADLSQAHSQTQPAQDYTRDQYFKDKAVRQQAQDSVVREDNERNGVPQLFRGCSVYINGYTKPGRLQLHEMLVRHGGEFVHYMTAKKNVTHIIATNLPLKKREEFAKYRVVKPEWIVESIERGRLLPWQSYAQLWDQGQDRIGPRSAPVDCTDPEFLNSFFENSRLHHLSNWKANLRLGFSDMNQPLCVPSKDDELFVFHVDFDCFFASVACLDFPSLDIHKDAIVVCHGTNNSDISSCNYAARRYGVKNGMWVSAAKKLLPRGVKLHCLPYNFGEIEAKSALFYKLLQKNEFIKFDQILPISIDESICVKISRQEEHLELEGICDALRNEIFRLTRCAASIGCSNSLILARLNLKKAKPNGSFIMFRENMNDSFLSGLAITDIPGVGYSTLSKLNSVNNGRHNFESLLQFKRALDADTSLAEAVSGKVGNKLTNKILLSLRGKDDEESLKMIYDPKSYFERKSVSIDINWGIRFKSIHEIDSFVDICTKYLIGKLNELQKKTSQINLKIMRRSKNAPIEPAKFLGMGQCDSSSRNSKLGVPTNEFGLLTTEVKNSFRCLSCPPSELRGISIQFSKLVDVDANQPDGLKRFLKLSVFQNLPNDVKPTFASELKRRKIQIKEPKVNAYQEKFLSEIPTQFRNEIKRDLIISEKIQESGLNKIHRKRIAKRTLLENAKVHLLGNSNESLFESIKFQGESSFKKICSKLMKWIDFTILDDGPHFEDLRLFENYLDKLSDSNRIPLILRISKLISNKLTLKSIKHSHEKGFQEWEQVLVRTIIPKLNKNKHTFQTVRKLDLDFDL